MSVDISENSVVVSAHQTLLCWDAHTRCLYLAELGEFPRDKFVRVRGEKFVVCGTSGGEETIPFDEIMFPGGAGRLAFTKGGRFLTGRPDGSVEFSATKLDTWEKFDCISEEAARRKAWRPDTASGGTELTLAGLRERLGDSLDLIDLKLNLGWRSEPKIKPRIAWIHNDINSTFEPLNEAEIVKDIDMFVFVSNWQKSRFLERYRHIRSKSCVIYNGIRTDEPGNQWKSDAPWRFRCAYISDPGRGLDTLLEVWKKLDPQDAELHIWSGTRLWGENGSDRRFYHLFAEAADTKGVFYHGIAENRLIRKALLEMHFLLMPSDFLETFCISAVEAMASGCRVLAPAIGALPEVVGEFGWLYRHQHDKNAHAEIFVEILNSEFRLPWKGDTCMRERQIEHVKQEYSWNVICEQWSALIMRLTSGRE